MLRTTETATIRCCYHPQVRDKEAVVITIAGRAEDVQKASSKSGVIKGTALRQGAILLPYGSIQPMTTRKPRRGSLKRSDPWAKWADEWQWEAAQSMGGQVGTKGQQQHRTQGYQNCS